ncbi:MAG: SoxR reducing system RseC family protein [Bacteroidales bacterium]|jgi:sigma-E factor negative regulatory protein RseC|nr:SoxR reducing system RseC family protein [Bacteroidales bacterium]
MKNECFEKNGQVVAVCEGKIKVKIERKSACVSCEAGKFCTSLDKKEQILSIVTNSADFHTGDEVIVQIRESLGMRAVVLSFVVPTLILVCAVFLLKSTFPLLNEGLIALIAIVFYSVYYFLLYIFRGKINKTFRLTVRKQQ